MANPIKVLGSFAFTPSLVSLAASGTLTPGAVPGANTLLDTSAPGAYELQIDTVNMAAADVLELRIYAFILTGGTRRVAYFQQYTGVQPTDDILKISPLIATDLSDSGAIRFELNQTLGTARAYPWKVLKYG